MRKLDQVDPNIAKVYFYQWFNKSVWALWSFDHYMYGEVDELVRFRLGTGSTLHTSRLMCADALKQHRRRTVKSSNWSKLEWTITITYWNLCKWLKTCARTEEFPYERLIFSSKSGGKIMRLTYMYIIYIPRED